MISHLCYARADNDTYASDMLFFFILYLIMKLFLTKTCIMLAGKLYTDPLKIFHTYYRKRSVICI